MDQQRYVETPEDYPESYPRTQPVPLDSHLYEEAGLLDYPVKDEDTLQHYNGLVLDDESIKISRAEKAKEPLLSKDIYSLLYTAKIGEPCFVMSVGGA